MTLYEQYKPMAARFERAGYSSLIQMMKQFESPTMMDRALGYVKATGQWLKGRNMPPPEAERRATAYLLQSDKPQVDEKQPSRMIIVSGHSDTIAKIERLAVILGAESTDV